MSENPHGFTYYGKTPSSIEMALSLDIDAAKNPQQIAEFCKLVDAELHKAGFTRSDRLDKPSYGGGQRPGNQRPEEKAPDGLAWEHCGQPGIYHEAYKNKNDKDVGARFTCRKGKQCEDVTSGGEWPASKFVADIKKAAKPAEKPVQPGQEPAGASKAPLSERLGGEGETIGYGDFLNAAIKIGYLRPGCIQFAGLRTEVELKQLGSEKWLDLLDKMRAVKKETVTA